VHEVVKVADMVDSGKWARPPKYRGQTSIEPPVIAFRSAFSELLSQREALLIDDGGGGGRR